MNLNNYDNRTQLLVDWIHEVVPSGGTLLDIGASDGSFCPELDSLEEDYAIDGVDPDESAMRLNHRLRHRFHGKLEAADIPRESHDAALAVYVAEHVEDPEAFLAAVSRGSQAWRVSIFDYAEW